MKEIIAIYKREQELLARYRKAKEAGDEAGMQDAREKHQAVEAHLALIQLHQLRNCYRQGWLPDWNDGRQDKYAIISFEDKYEITKFNFNSRFLAFQDEITANEFLINFRKLIEQAGDLI